MFAIFQVTYLIGLYGEFDTPLVFGMMGLTFGSFVAVVLSALSCSPVNTINLCIWFIFIFPVPWTTVRCSESICWSHLHSCYNWAALSISLTRPHLVVIVTIESSDYFSHSWGNRGSERWSDVSSTTVRRWWSQDSKLRVAWPQARVSYPLSSTPL